MRPGALLAASAGLSRLWPAGARTGDLVWLLSGHARQPERLTLGFFLAPPFREAPLYPSPARARRLGGAADRSQQASRRVGRGASRRPRTLLSELRAGGILAASLHPKFAHRVPAQASHRRPLAAVRLQAALPSRLFPSRPSSEAAERCLTGRPAATGCSPSRRAVDASGVLATHRVEACASTCRQASPLTSRELRPILVNVSAQAASSLP